VRLLTGHTDTVNTVRFLQTSSGLVILSGSVDKTVRVWEETAGNAAGPGFECVQVLEDHQGSINWTAGSEVFATGSADATVKIWTIRSEDDKVQAKLVQSISIKPRFFPLALAISRLQGSDGSYILAVAGTTAIAQLYISESTSVPEFKFRSTLSGHEGWIRSLSFTHETADPASDLLLASASQDKYIRLWRIHQGKELPAAAAAGSDPVLGAFLPGKSLSNKAHRFTAQGNDYSATFEALLLGHEDWIYTVNWNSRGKTLQLLSGSADSSLAIWESDPTSGVWVTVARLGEISAQKGSTTATGSTGGFWTGLWSPAGDTVVTLGRTGSWRLWNYNTSQERWLQSTGISGHILPVTGISWSQHGDYLLSTSSDQTTRLHAQWKRDNVTTWHEMSRPQIHGYDLNCISTLGPSSFVSGADEKLLRVFAQPKAVAELLSSLCGIVGTDVHDMPDAANMPVLGLSNKAIDAVGDDVELEQPNHYGQDRERDAEAIDPSSVVHKSTLLLEHPPLEDHLSRHTLFPEIEKLYGHGYEISSLATSADGTLIATACKASSIDHAVIRIFETTNWTELKPALAAHSLTVTRLRFSADSRFLLSVGRDRQWAVYERDGTDNLVWRVKEQNLKGHSRMILDAAWFPETAQAFATAGRDKVVKLWGLGVGDGGADQEGKGGFVLKGSIAVENPVTALDFADVVEEGKAWLAIGTEAGRIAVYRIDVVALSVLEKYSVELRYVLSLCCYSLSSLLLPFLLHSSPFTSRQVFLYRMILRCHTHSLCPSKAITQLSWRPSQVGGSGREVELAVASEDCSLRIYNLKGILSAFSS